MKNIIVIFGGISPEHDVSIITGCLVLNSLDTKLYNPIPLYVSREGEFYTGKLLKDVGFYKNFNYKKVENVVLIANSNVLYKKKGLKKLCFVHGAINCMHGGRGENGTIAALFDLCRIPLAGEGLYQSALSMDKYYTKLAAKSIGIPYIDGLLCKRGDFYFDQRAAVLNMEKSFDYPLIVKPCTLGSSVGISVANDRLQLTEALIYAFTFDDRVIVEKYMQGFTEINCACYKKGDKICVSLPEKPISSHSILTFEDKYGGVKALGAEREFPAIISEEVIKKISEYTKTFYTQFGFSFIVRMDYLIVNNKVFLNEVNAVPGSLAYYLYYDTIRGLTDLLTDLLTQSFIKDRQNKSKIEVFESNILSAVKPSIKK